MAPWLGGKVIAGGSGWLGFAWGLWPPLRKTAAR